MGVTFGCLGHARVLQHKLQSLLQGCFASRQNRLSPSSQRALINRHVRRMLGKRFTVIRSRTHQHKRARNTLKVVGKVLRAQLWHRGLPHRGHRFAHGRGGLGDSSDFCRHPLLTSEVVRSDLSGDLGAFGNGLPAPALRASVSALAVRASPIGQARILKLFEQNLKKGIWWSLRPCGIPRRGLSSTAAQTPSHRSC